MDAREVLDQARDAMTVKRVFGEPYEKDGVTVVPVANVMGGAGAGGGSARAGAAKPAGDGDGAGEAGEPAAGDTGYGMGYGLRATPAGVYVIKDGEVEWEPAVDVGRLMAQRGLVIIVGLLILRSIIRTLARR
jgi:uncharacterized spore protein YtfJ